MYYGHTWRWQVVRLAGLLEGQPFAGVSTFLTFLYSFRVVFSLFELLYFIVNESYSLNLKE